MNTDETLLPGEELVQQGLAELAEGKLTDYALLVLIASPQLRRLGMSIPDVPLPAPAEHKLYERIEERLGPGAHSYYNNLIRRIVSYARAREHVR